MFVIKGRFNEAVVYANNIDSETKTQIKHLLDQEFVKNSIIRIMPDCHAGIGCVIGTTMTITDKIVPNLVGVDIGCGMLTIKLGKIDIIYKNLDNFIRQNIPAGLKVHSKVQPLDVNIKKMKCFDELDRPEYYFQSVGTLGSGNHFIEIGVDDFDNKYLIIHSGSRHLGHQVAQYYQRKAKKYIEQQYLKRNIPSLIPKDLCYLEGKDYQDYLHDMNICQQYASENRYRMAKKILNYLNLSIKNLDHFETIHNYINLKDMILRKGAISVYRGERVLIPINMKDGSIIAIGKGNKEYNYSAPHGAGRIISRRQAKQVLSLEKFERVMEGIYTTSISKDTLDEAPFVYKPMEEILENIQDTVEVLQIIKPVYNFKAN
ncbi:MAG: RtcB family protein [Acholeplasmataceae bacterium]|nr:RtcB family protein [Acholeplasmataceae bacterium]